LYSTFRIPSDQESEAPLLPILLSTMPRPRHHSPHSSLMMEAARASETSVDNYFTRHYIPEDNSELHTCVPVEQEAGWAPEPAPTDDDEWVAILAYQSYFHSSK
jgi:hypothetical protein